MVNDAEFSRTAEKHCGDQHMGGAKLFSKFLSDEEGQTLVEYGLLMSLIALVIIAAVSLFGRRNLSSFNNSSNTLPF